MRDIELMDFSGTDDHTSTPSSLVPQSVYMINNIEAMPKGTLSFADTESNKWWETAMLTKLSAASNRLRFIGSGIKNLPELTTLDVSLSSK